MNLASPASEAGSRALRGLFAIALIAVLHVGKPVFVPMVGAVVLALALAPVVRALERTGLAPMLSAAIVVASLLLAAGAGIASLSEPASRWWSDAPQTLNRFVQRVDEWRADIPLIAPPAASAPKARGRAPAPPPPADPLHEKLALQGAEVGWTLVGGTTAFLLGAAASLLLLFFLLASERWMIDRAQLIYPRRRTRHLVLAGMRHAQRDIARYIATQAIINSGVALAVGLSLAWLGVPNPALWGTITGLLNFIPYLGPLIAMALLVVVGAQTFEIPSQMFAPAGAAFAIHAVESNLITPLFVGRRLSMHPLALLLAVMCGAALWGLAGAMLAVPVLIAVRCVSRRRRSLRWLCILLADERDTAPLMRAWRMAHRQQAGRARGGTGSAAASTRK